MREFILLALKAPTTPDFDINNLPDYGRLDLVCRTISNTIYVSDALRQDTIVHVSLNGPKDPPKLISFHPNQMKGFRPDERTFAKAIQNALKESLNLKMGDEKLVAPGITIAKKAFETLVKEKSQTSQLVYLHERGDDLRKFNFQENVTFILGDFVGMPKKTEKLLKRLGAQRMNLGPVVLFASHCSILVHNELDRRMYSHKF